MSKYGYKLAGFSVLTINTEGIGKFRDAAKVIGHKIANDKTVTVQVILTMAKYRIPIVQVIQTKPSCSRKPSVALINFVDTG